MNKVHNSIHSFKQSAALLDERICGPITWEGKTGDFIQLFYTQVYHFFLKKTEIFQIIFMGFLTNIW